MKATFIFSRVSRQPELVLCSGSKKLLAIPKVTTKSGQSKALAIKEALNDRKLEDKIVAMGFDITISNSNKWNLSSF